MARLADCLRRVFLPCLSLVGAALGGPVALAAEPPYQPYSDLYVFGDSLSDTGRVQAMTGSLFPGVSPYYQGRWSNGPVAAELLALNLGLDSAHFHDYAVGGAKTGPFNQFPALGRTGLIAQVDDFRHELAEGSAKPGALYMVWAGPNDFFENLFDTGLPQRAADNVEASVASLWALGARHIVVPLMYELDKLPLYFGQAASQAMGALQSAAYNAQLQASMANLGQSLAGVDIRVFDTVALYRQVALQPQAYGFSDLTASCVLGTPPFIVSVCGDPDGRIFWDEVHPSAKAQRLLADGLYQTVRSVPEPDAWRLLVAGVAVVVVVLGKSRRHPVAPTFRKSAR